MTRYDQRLAAALKFLRKRWPRELPLLSHTNERAVAEILVALAIELELQVNRFEQAPELLKGKSDGND